MNNPSFQLPCYGSGNAQDNLFVHLAHLAGLQGTPPVTLPEGLALTAENNATEYLALKIMNQIPLFFTHFYGSLLLQRLSTKVARVMARNPSMDSPRPANFSLSPEVLRNFILRPDSGLSLRHFAPHFRPDFDPFSCTLRIGIDTFAPKSCLRLPRGTTALAFTVAACVIPDYLFMEGSWAYEPLFEAFDPGTNVTFTSGFLPVNDIIREHELVEVDMLEGIPLPTGSTLLVFLGLECYTGNEGHYASIPGARNAIIRSVIPGRTFQDMCSDI